MVRSITGAQAPHKTSGTGRPYDSDTAKASRAPEPPAKNRRDKPRKIPAGQEGAEGEAVFRILRTLGNTDADYSRLLLRKGVPLIRQGP